MVAGDTCTCIESGECSCEPFECFCECECEGCLEMEFDGCPCGGNCGCGNQEKTMNPMKIISLGMTFYNINKGIGNDGKKILDEGMDIIQAISIALKDGKITNSEKHTITKEIKEFSKVSIKAIEKLTIPESD